MTSKLIIHVNILLPKVGTNVRPTLLLNAVRPGSLINTTVIEIRVQSKIKHKTIKKI